MVYVLDTRIIVRDHDDRAGVVINRAFVFALRGKCTETRNKCGGSYHRLVSRPSDRVVETSGAQAGRPLDRAAIKVPRLLKRRPCFAVRRELNVWRDLALHDMKIAGDFVLISAMTESRLSRLDG